MSRQQIVQGVPAISNQPTVMKFGGTSVEDARAFQRVAQIVGEQENGALVVIVSAMAGVTDALLKCFAGAVNGQHDLAELAYHLDRHDIAARELLGDASEFSRSLDQARDELGELLKNANSEVAQSLSRPLLQDLFISYGERLSATLLAAVLEESGIPGQYVDARRCIQTDAQHGRAEPLREQTERLTRTHLASLIGAGKIPVLGGFIGATADGTTTTLGRGGSDYTAALIGAALNAQEIQIWTDVPGVLTADPRILREARTIARLSYGEAAELAYFGAKVLHPKTIQPAVEQNIPVRICNTRAPAETGTVVCQETEVSPQAVKAIAHKTGITLVQITSARMLGAHGFLHAIFEIFNRHRTAIDIVTTSEVSVSLSLDDTSSLPAIKKELEQLGSVRIETEQAIVCVVGEGLRNTAGVAARIFGCLSDINIELISQGASSINLTFVVAEHHVQEAVSRLHETFMLNSIARSLEEVHA